MSNVTDSERLMVLVEARITDLERNMKKASATTGREFGKMRRDAGGATTAMERDMQRASTRINQATTSIAGSVGAMSKAFAGGLIGGVAAMGVTGIVRQMRDVAESVANIGSEAQRAGVSVQAFQELGYVASQNRIPIDALTDGLKELNLRTDELLQTGTGPAAESFHRLGYTAEELKEKLKDPSALLVEIIGRLGQLDRASQIRISDELFGGSAGERFVELIDDGADGIRDMIDEAHEFGLVMDEDMIAKADEIDRKFKLISQTVGTALRGAIVDAAEALGSFIDQFRDFENQSARTRAATLGGSLRDLSAERQAVEEEIRNLRATDSDSMLPDAMRGMNERTLIPQQEARLRQLRGEEERIRRLMEAESMDALDRMPPTLRQPPVSTLNDEPFESGGGSGGAGGRGRGGARGERTRAAREERDAVAELIAELEREQALIGASDVERSISNALRQAGADATDAQRAQISELVSQIEEEMQATERLRDAQDEMRSVAQDSLRTIVDGMRSGADAGEILGSVIDRLAEKLIELAIQNMIASMFSGGLGGGLGGGGGLLGMIGSLFGGGRASGGNVDASKFYVVGEKGPELFAPGRSGTVVPNQALAAPSAPQVSVNSSPKISIENHMLPPGAPDREPETTTEANGDTRIRNFIRGQVRDEVNRPGTPTNRNLKAGGLHHGITTR
jgi:gas vesicle protein